MLCKFIRQQLFSAFLLHPLSRKKVMWMSSKPLEMSVCRELRLTSPLGSGYLAKYIEYYYERISVLLPLKCPLKCIVLINKGYSMTRAVLMSLSC